MPEAAKHVLAERLQWHMLILQIGATQYMISKLIDDTVHEYNLIA